MKKTLIILLFQFISIITFGQNQAGAEKLVNDGIAYHDKGDYIGAISKYNKALELDKDNLMALSEKALTLLVQNKFDESIKLCEKAIEAHPGDIGLKTLYITYGNAYDGLKKADRSIEVYDQALKQFPDFYQYYFNKGITLSGIEKFDEAMLCFQSSVKSNPRHASSHNAIGVISNMNHKRIPAILAYCRFLGLESEGKRAEANLAILKNLMNGSVEKTGKNAVTIKVSPEMLGDTVKGEKHKENSFATADLLLAMSSALDFEKELKQTEVQQFNRKFGGVCSSLKESAKDNSGFFWEYYAPYFIEMKDKNLIETFSYIVFSSSATADVKKWLKSNKTQVDKFFEWSKSFEWKSN